MSKLARNLSEAAADVESKHGSTDVTERNRVGVKSAAANCIQERISTGDNVTVAHLNDATASGRCFRVMSDHDDRLIEAVI